MKKYILHWSLVLTILSCTKEQGLPGAAGAQGPAGANGKGSAADTASIAGSLILSDEFCNIQNDASGVTVTLSNGSQLHTATSDVSGHYYFPGLTTGTYDLSFQRSGYGTMKIFGLSHFAGGTMPTPVQRIFMFQNPVKTAPDTLTLSSNTSTTVMLDLRLDTSSQQYSELSSNLMIFISKHKTVGPNDYSVLLNSIIFADGSGGYNAYFYKSDVLGLEDPINTGDTLYAVGYSCNQSVRLASDDPTNSPYGGAGAGGYYIDPQTGKIVYPDLSKPSNVVNFVF